MPDAESSPDNTTAAEDAANRTASRAGRVLAYWRWRKIRELLDAAGQLALFDHEGRSTEDEAAHDDRNPGR